MTAEQYNLMKRYHAYKLNCEIKGEEPLPLREWIEQA